MSHDKWRWHPPYFKLIVVSKPSLCFEIKERSNITSKNRQSNATISMSNLPALSSSLKTMEHIVHNCKGARADHFQHPRRQEMMCLVSLCQSTHNAAWIIVIQNNQDTLLELEKKRILLLGKDLNKIFDAIFNTITIWTVKGFGLLVELPFLAKQT